MNGTEVLEGVVERIVFSSAETLFTVFQVRLSGGREATVVGRTTGLRPGESVRAGGAWVEDRRFGTQFRAESLEVVPPSTVEGLRRYLGSGLVPGIGPVLAERLVRRFGAETLRVIESKPERLLEIEGIGRRRAKDIARAIASRRDAHEVLAFLQAQGIGPALAARIYEKYGRDTVAFVRSNPYRLAAEVAGIGFRTADAMATSLGIASDSPDRALAAVFHVLREAAGEGHACLPRGELEDRTGLLLGGKGEALRTAIEEGAARRDLVLDERPRSAIATPAPEEDRLVYLRPLHAAETGCAALLLRMVRRPPSPPLAAPGIVDAAARSVRLAPDAAQRAAVLAALREPVSVLTGGPGVGKTTIVRLLVEAARRRGFRLLLASPTGRAAKRLSEVTREPASTLHRLLGFEPRTGRFARGPESTLPADLVVVDETSMLDVHLAYALLRAIRPPTRLLFVGDADQLPSVGPGNVLRDLVGSGRVAVTRLTQIYRQREGSLIVENAHRILRGEMPTWPRKGEARSDFYFVPREEGGAVLAAIRRIVVERIPKAFGLDPRRDVQVIAPMYRGEAGVDALNRSLREALNPTGPTVGAGARTFRVGDRVIALRNDYDKEVFNGDVGHLESVDPETGAVAVAMEGRRIAYEPNELDDLAPAWAISVHRAQGSEYPAVVAPLVTAHYLLLRRPVLYTAITRARRLVVLVGSRRALGIAVRNASESRRHSVLGDRLRFAGEAPAS